MRTVVDVVLVVAVVVVGVVFVVVIGVFGGYVKEFMGFEVVRLFKRCTANLRVE